MLLTCALRGHKAAHLCEAGWDSKIQGLLPLNSLVSDLIGMLIPNLICTGMYLRPVSQSARKLLQAAATKLFQVADTVNVQKGLQDEEEKTPSSFPTAQNLAGKS